MTSGALVLAVSAFVLQPAREATACSTPDLSTVAAAFDRVGNGAVPAGYPQIPPGSAFGFIPPSVLKAVGWVESGWRQFRAPGRPLVSFDFGYGIMQVTSGMAGAFGRTKGSLDPETQSRIASDYLYNVAYGAKMLVQKRQNVPMIGDGDPRVIEGWYYALWAYNGWGWTNNPNNPRFSRAGTPATNPSSYPYQERVLYLVAHPPRDAAGNRLWAPIPVSLPSRKLVGRTPKVIPTLAKSHREMLPALSAAFNSSSLPPLKPNTKATVTVRVTNTGTQTWSRSGISAVTLVYHVLTVQGDPWGTLSPFSPGMLYFGQGPVGLPQDVAPGQSVTLHPVVQAPAAPGQYRLVWDLQQGSSAWFSQLGAPPGVATLTVLKRNQTPTPRPSRTPSATAITTLKFVVDTSLPEGTVVAAQKIFKKGWLVFNAGSTAWPAGTVLRRLSGKPFSPARIRLAATPNCRSLNIVVKMRAPSVSGNYRSVWRLQDPNGKLWGDKLVLGVTVGKSGTGAAGQGLGPVTGIAKR